MAIGTALRILGILLMIFSVTMVPPLAISLWTHDNAHFAFLTTLLTSFGTGLLLWLIFRRHEKQLQTRDGFIIVVLFWISFCLVGSIPFQLFIDPALGFTDAFFESVSGLTTTGATTIVKLDVLPTSVLYYRQQLQFLGGMGIIILAIAILPMLGIGGLQLYRAEVTGPVKDTKLTPRMAETAKALWFIYVGLTFVCIIAYYNGGMTFFDAVCYGFSTISTGGFAPHDSSFDRYDTAYLKLTATFFMLFGAINFALHFVAFKRLSLRHYWKDAEVKTFLGMLLLILILSLSLLDIEHVYHHFFKTLTEGLFLVTSILTTTGFTNAAYTTWPAVLPILLILGGVIGGCAWSTSGGIKSIRALLLLKQGSREVKRLVHPHGLFPVKVNAKSVPPEVLDAAWSFIGFYLFVLVFFIVTLMMIGVDFETAVSGTLSCLANIGPAAGKLLHNYAEISDTTKWILAIIMLIGRLEIFTVIVLLTPVFWKN